MFLTSSLSKRWPTIFFILVLSLSSFHNVYSQSLLTNPDSIPFATAVPYRVDYQIFSLFCADLDGDMNSDIAVAHSWIFPPNESSCVSILKNRGDGTFYRDSCFKVGDHPLSIFCADLDGDKAVDLVEVADEIDSVYILKNNGNGTFQTRVGYATGYYPSSVFCSDLDGDTDLDLAVTDYNSTNVSILKNNGDGTFQPKVDHSAGVTPYSVFCADLDGDADFDLATANLRNDNVSVLKNNGDATFQNNVTYGVGDGPVYIYSSDLDGDSDMDLALANLSGNSISILKNNGDGTFQPKIDYTTEGYPWSVFCADLDEDHDQDIAVANGATSNVAILTNNNDGTFKPAIKYYVSTEYRSSPNSVFCADLDGDKDLDLVVGDRISAWVYVLKNLTINLSRFYPVDKDSVKNPIIFNWQAMTIPLPEDTVRYDLYLSRSETFDPDSTLVYHGLRDTVLIDSLDLQLWYWKVKAYDQSGTVRYSDPGWNLYVYLNGDCNGNGEVSTTDIVFLINFLFKDGSAPNPFKSGDVNCDGYVRISDVVYLINYLFKGGPLPANMEFQI